MDSYDIIVVGSGHNALVAAAYLARAGREVLILERNDRPGGLVRTEEMTLPGYLHDVYSAVHPLLHAGPVWADLGEELTARGLSYVNPDPPTGVSFPDGRTAVLHRSMDAMVAEADQLSPGDGDAFAAWMSAFAPYAGDVFGLLSRELSEPGARAAIGRLLRGDGAGLTPFAVDLFDTAQTTVSRFSSPVLRAMLASWVLHMGRTPNEPGSGIWVTLFTQTAMRAGMPFPVGGSEALVTALTQLVTEHGGRIVTGTEVHRILVDQGRATGVVTADGTRMAARQAVLACTNADQLYLKLLGGDAPDTLRAQAARYRYGRGCVQIHLALREPPRWPDPRFATIGQPFLTSGLDECALAVAQGMAGLLPADPTFTVDCPTALDPSRAPAGAAILRIQLLEMPIRPRGDAAGVIDVGDGGWSDDLTNRLVDRVITMVGRHIPNIPDAIAAHAVTTPDDLARYNPNCGPGDPYGGAHDLAQSYLLRPLPGQPGHRTPIDGLYQLGAGTWPGAGVSGGSGFIVARQLLGA
ncbi:phytoene desaturase family protein [Micromonospora sp. WMMD558]|uniref:phytoene desaturase family protein n=1 Tax=unclassified Micromonospora TaxID=2617518 RepID=UPI0012B45126|nr:NAD(P)/FAD-dependent oxidoreductase [Micromonospora sp. WMMC415]QGN47656.1 NAD(P)-binding protein [Micromonospora sp. WMMC415]